MIRLFAALRLILTLVIDTVRSSVVIAWDVLTPTDRSRVQVLDFATRAESDLELTLLSIAITLTPGTLTLDVDDDRRVLHIHAMYAQDPQAILADIRDRVETPLLVALRGRRP